MCVGPERADIHPTQASKRGSRHAAAQRGEGSSPATAVNPWSRRAVSRPPVAQPASRILAAREGRARAMSEVVVASRAGAYGGRPLPVAVAESSYLDHSQ